MKIRMARNLAAVAFLLAILTGSRVLAQEKGDSNDSASGPAILHEDENIAAQNTFLGPGGEEMKPDLSSVTLIKRETGGYNKKYRIKDAQGRIWIAKYGREAKPETAAVRLLWALGYPTEINYWVPELTIPGMKTLRNVRLEARPENIKRGDNWNWKHNPFSGTDELQGLKIMMVLFNNWDISENQNKIIQDKETGRSYYIISDLGGTFGKLGSNSLPIFWRLGRSINKPEGYAKTSLVKDVKKGRVKLAYKGKHSSIFDDITISQARWLVDRLRQLREEQIRDAFRAADYSPRETDLLTNAVKTRISELEAATSNVERIARREPSPGKAKSRRVRTRRH
jgi:hypothetical protein